ncbi:MAG: hypothetical protein V4614_14450 [Pseudomonadota bacterium]
MNSADARPAPLSHYLMIRSAGSLDLPAAEAAMAEVDFEVLIAWGEEPLTLDVIWQPHPVLHPEYQRGGMLDLPPVESCTLQFQDGEVSAHLRRDIAEVMLNEERAIPEALAGQGLVHLSEIDTANTPRHMVAMRYALLAELTATAAKPDDVVIYDTGTACITPTDVREWMNWREMLYLLDDPFPFSPDLGVEDPDFQPATDTAARAEVPVFTPAPASAPTPARVSVPPVLTPVPVPAPGNTTSLQSPGQQSSTPSWVWAGLAMAVAAVVAYLLFGGK